MIRVEEIPDARSLSTYEGAWKELVARAPQASVFDSYEWQTSWLQAFWPDQPIRYLFFWDGGSLVGIAPLLAGGSWCGARALVSTAHPHSYRANVVCSTRPEELFQALLAHVRDWDEFPTLAFPNAPADASVAAVLPRIAAEEKLSAAVIPATPSPILRIGGSWDAYLRGHSKNLAKQVRKKLRRFESAGSSRLAVVSRPGECESAVAEAVRVEARSWKEQIDGSLSGNPRMAALHRAFALAAARSGIFRLYLLYLEERAVAFVYGAVFRNEFYAFKTSYDTAYQELSPGTVVFDRVFRDAFDQGLAVVDLGPGAGLRWKNEFSNDVREHVDVCVFSPLRLRCQACKGYRKGLKPLLRRALPGLVAWRRRLTTRDEGPTEAA